MPAPRSKSAKKPSALDLLKEDINRSQVQIDDLTNQIDSVKKSISYQEEEEHRLRRKLRIILPEILAHRDREKFPLEPVNDVVDVNEDCVRLMVQAMIDDLHGRQSDKSLIELRIEELEQRVTEQNTNYQSITRKNLRCMEGVKEALECSSPHEVKFLLRRLKQDLLVEDPIDRPSSAPAPRQHVVASQLAHSQLAHSQLAHSQLAHSQLAHSQLPPADEELPFADANIEFLKSMENRQMTTPRPIRKHSGDTHVKHLLPDLREVICKELSLESCQRGDWRHFAHLIGISTETIQFWRRLDMHNPMEQVINFWKDQSSANVRLLHRILMSQQLKAVHLAKLVSEFYYID
ncbi:uncharacterized protein [Watersipora subatra]|uniref:uncharacterized protein n=1 Tax=Watersipora subatra TaxID=2589382 RepID=UPI00355C557C